jgi:signal transduction histidine kinase
MKKATAAQLDNAVQHEKRELSASEISLRNIILRNADGIIIVDRRGIVRFANPAAESLFGRSRHELVAARFGFPITTGEISEIDIVCKGGTLAIAEMRVVEIEWEGEITYLASLRDITERKQAEELRIQLMYEKVLQQQTEKVRHIKDELLAILAHELRTPLTAILGWTRLLRNKKLDAETIDHAIDIVERNAQLQTQIITDLIDMACLVTGKIQLNIEPVELVTVINGALDVARPAAAAKNLNIKISFDTNRHYISGDANRLHQVIWALLSNAIKFTPKDGYVEIQLAHTAAGAEISIMDNGIGIAADFLPHIFDYFKQGNSSSTREFGGLGIGLAIARYLIELHGGTITAASAGKEQGAAFKIILPRLENSIP